MMETVTTFTASRLSKATIQYSIVDESREISSIFSDSIDKLVLGEH
jgi:hypothetical protein